MTWPFSDLFNNIPSNVKITVLTADPKLSGFCSLEHIPRDIKNLNARVLMGIGHCLPRCHHGCYSAAEKLNYELHEMTCLVANVVYNGIYLSLLFVAPLTLYQSSLDKDINAQVDRFAMML